MKKEMLVAVAIGFLLGLIITFGIYRLRVTKGRQSASPVATPISSAVPSETDTLITIHNPEDGLVQKEKSTTVTGSTVPDTYVVLSVNTTDYIRQSDQDGNFSFEVPLEDGSNLLTLQVLMDDGTTLTKERTVVVTSLYDQPLEETATSSATATPTPKATVTPTAKP